MISKELLRYPDQFVLYLSKQERDIGDIKRSMKGYVVGRTIGRQQIDTNTFATGDAGNGWTGYITSDGRQGYRCKGSLGNFTHTGSGWGTRGIVQLPPGTNISQFYVSGSLASYDAAITYDIVTAGSSTWIDARWQNKYGGAVTTGASYTFDIVRT